VKTRAAVLVLISGMWVGLPSAARAQQADPDMVGRMKEGDAAAVQRLLQRGADPNVRAKDGATALHWAAHRNEIDAVRRLLRAGATPNVANVYGVTPLSLACLNGNATIVGALLDGGADANAPLPSGETPLMTAARTGNVAVVGALLAHGAKIDVQEKTKGQTALMWAAAENHEDVVETLIKAGARVDVRSMGGFTALLFAARSGSVAATRALLAAAAPINETTPKRETPLLIAAASGHDALARFLLAERADPNLADESGFSPLHAAIWGQRDTLEMVKALIAAGANIEAKLLKPPPPLSLYALAFAGIGSMAGATPFALAAAHANLPVMRALVDAGADPLMSANDGTTALLLAAGHGWTVGNSPVTLAQGLEAVKAMAAWGGDVNTANTAGLTPLHVAANNGADDIIQFLIDHGANVNVKDKRGRTPIQIARAANIGGAVQEFTTVVERLRRAGAVD
jgi:ankyrin repeat protein